MNLPNGITAEQWGEVCERMGWWKRGERLACANPEHSHAPFDYPKLCPPVTDERLMQVLRIVMTSDYQRKFFRNWTARAVEEGSLDAAIIRAYLALPKDA